MPFSWIRCFSSFMRIPPLSFSDSSPGACYRRIVRQMVEAEGVTEDMKRQSQMEWVRAMNSIANRAEEIVNSSADGATGQPAPSGPSPPLA